MSIVRIFAVVVLLSLLIVAVLTVRQTLVTSAVSSNDPRVSTMEQNRSVLDTVTTTKTGDAGYDDWVERMLAARAAGVR